MIPITIISGFLGSGKTTLLNNLLRQHHGERVAVLVNDFGSIDIDGALVVSVEGETLALSGGCICCTIRADLEETVIGLIKSEEPPERIVIEASGVSDPTSVAMTFFAGRLKKRCRVDTIVTMVDSDAYLQTDASMEPLLKGQLRVADLVVLNKADLCDEETLDEVENDICCESPYARIIRTRFAEVPAQLLFGLTEAPLLETVAKEPIPIHVHEAEGHHHHHHHDDHTLIFDTWSFSEDAPMYRYRLMKALADLPTSVYRAKGFVYAEDVPDHEVIVHVAGRRAHQQRGRLWGDRPKRTQLVFISGQGQLPLEHIREDLLACTREEVERSPNIPMGAGEFMARFSSKLRSYGLME